MPKHRANKLQKTTPVIQPAGRHRADVNTVNGVTSTFDSEAFGQLLHDIGPGNPYRGASS